MLPPGYARLVASPAWIASPPIQTIGIAPVAARTAFARASLLATITSGLRSTTSRARSAIALGPALARISLDCEVLSLDIARPAQLLKKRPPGANSRVADAGDGACGNDDRYPALFRRLLRPQRLRGGRPQQTRRHIAPPHSP